MLEYNTWRAMTMLNGGNIKGNFNFDDAGQPLSTAAGNKKTPNICWYRLRFIIIRVFYKLHKLI